MVRAQFGTPRSKVNFLTTIHLSYEDAHTLNVSLSLPPHPFPSLCPFRLFKQLLGKRWSWRFNSKVLTQWFLSPVWKKTTVSLREEKDTQISAM